MTEFRCKHGWVNPEKQCPHCKEIEKLRSYIKGALAALTQNKTYPADIEAAKSFLYSALEK